MSNSSEIPRASASVPRPPEGDEDLVELAARWARAEHAADALIDHMIDLRRQHQAFDERAEPFGPSLARREADKIRREMEDLEPAIALACVEAEVSDQAMKRAAKRISSVSFGALGTDALARGNSSASFGVLGTDALARGKKIVETKRCPFEACLVSDDHVHLIQSGACQCEKGGYCLGPPCPRFRPPPITHAQAIHLFGAARRMLSEVVADVVSPASCSALQKIVDEIVESSPQEIQEMKIGDAS